MSLQDFKDNVAKSAFGITKADAHRLQICINCRKGVDLLLWSEIDRKEYFISGICPTCWDNMFKED